MEISLVYEPSEIEIIETFDFDEDIQRPEELRFFTLEEQLTDYFQKVLPKKNHVTKAEIWKIRSEVDRIQSLYEDLIVMTDTDYRIDSQRRDIDVPWLKSIYGGFDYEKYLYSAKLLPLTDPSTRRTPNGYPVLLAALPRPYRSEGTDGVLVTKSTDLVNEEGNEMVHALGNYVRTKRINHDDGTFDITNVPVASTGDDIRRVGFFIEDRKLDIPHPLADHPFLSSAKANKIITSEPLKDVFPTIEAIMSHAVPVTKDPYTEGKKYLNLYDIKISEIPWKSWKERFPPVDTIQSEPTTLSIVFPTSNDAVAPSDRLQKIYDSKWSKSVNPRAWLMQQEDGGLLVAKMLLSDAGEFGLIAPDLVNERPVIQLPKSTAEECLQTDNFESFLSSGVFRSPTYTKKGSNWVEVTPGLCAPTAFISQERQELMNKNKKAWSETTQTNIQKDYVSLLNFYKAAKVDDKEVKYEQYKDKDKSDLRDNILIILKDPTLLPPDKSYNIRLLIKEITPVKNQYYDNDVAVVCNHTLAELDGDLESNRFEFYTKWSTLYEGSRICNSCGVEINNDSYVAQEEYDDNGHLVLSHDVLAGGIQVQHPLANSVSQLKNVFNMENAGEILMYSLLSRFQIIPDERQLIPILGNIRKGSVAAKKLPDSARHKFEGLLGIAGTVTLLQIHNPFLVPRRSFGNKVVKMSGFPRDTQDDKDSPVLNMILSDLRDFLQTLPSIKGPLSAILNEATNNRKKIREESVRFIKQAYTEFKPQFEAARERSSVSVSAPIQENRIFLPEIVPKKYEFKPGDKQGEEQFSKCSVSKPKTTFVSKLMPSVTQKSLDMYKAKPSSYATYIVPEEVTVTYTFPDKKEIERGVKIGIPKTAKLEAIRTFAEKADGIALSSLLLRLLDILAPLKFPSKTIVEYRKFVENINSFTNASLFRDAVKGKVYELLDSVKDGMLDEVRKSISQDLGMNMILLTKDKSEKQVEVLRSRERETFKQRLRDLDDRSREAMKMLIDIGISQYIITNEDRKFFAMQANLPQTIDDDKDDPETVPEGGFTSRDYVDGVELLNENGKPIEPDRGDYGDMRDRPEDDYALSSNFDIEE